MNRSSKHILIRSALAMTCSGIIALTAIGAAPGPQAQTTAETDPSVVRSLVASAEESMANGEWSLATESWQKALEASPDSAEIAYNLGVAAYRGGQYDQSAKAFETAASLADADLAAHAMYNEGTARYAEALDRLNQAEDQGALPMGSMGEDGAAPADPIKDAIDRVSDALTHFKDAAGANPQSDDARANAELATRLLKQLKEIQQQQQQQQQDQQQQQQQQQQDQQ